MMIVPSDRSLERLGQRTARRILHQKKRQKGRFAAPSIIALVGPLGAGKTTFLRGFARGLGIRRRVVSPTFLLARRYRIPKGADSQIRRFADSSRARRGRKSNLPVSRSANLPRWFWHLDVYRL